MSEADADQAWQGALRVELERAGRDGLPVSVAVGHVEHADDPLAGLAAPDADLLDGALKGWQDVLRLVDVQGRAEDGLFTVALHHCALDAAVDVVNRLGDRLPSGLVLSAGVAQWDGIETDTALESRARAAWQAARGGGQARVVRAN